MSARFNQRMNGVSIRAAWGMGRLAIVRLAAVVGCAFGCVALPGAVFAAGVADVEEVPIEELQEIYEDSMGLWTAAEPGDAMAVLAREGAGLDALPPLDLSQRFERWFDEVYRELVSEQR